jgi:hypothetical protein
MEPYDQTWSLLRKQDNAMTMEFSNPPTPGVINLWLTGQMQLTASLHMAFFENLFSIQVSAAPEKLHLKLNYAMTQFCIAVSSRKLQLLYTLLYQYLSSLELQQSAQNLASVWF